MNIDNTICEPFITERIIEYERRLPFKNFTNKHLFPMNQISEMEIVVI